MLRSSTFVIYYLTVIVLDKFRGGRELVPGRELVHHHYFICYMFSEVIYQNPEYRNTSFGRYQLTGGVHGLTTYF